MKITRILVALSFLFAVVTANAGQLTVNGSITATYQSEVNNVTGNPFGMDRELSFTGSTELDNGMTVSYLQDTGETFAFGDTELVFGNVFGLATLRLGSDYDPMDAADDITPSAFEEANGAGSGDYTATGQDIGALRTLGTHIGGAIAIPYLGTLAANYYPKTDAQENSDGVSSAATGSSSVGSGYSATLTTPMNGLPIVGSMLDGLVLTTGIEEQETSTTALTADRLGLTAALNYAYGPVKIGYQKKFADLGQTTAGAGQIIYRDDIVGIAYAINDSLSLSWNRYDSVRSTAADANVEQSTTAINIGYTVGGMTFGFQDASTDNSGYTTGTNNDTRRLQLVVAF
jgi:outer membrane protein OmpU